MALFDFFKKRNKTDQSYKLIDLLVDNGSMDNPNIIYLAVDVVSNYGELLEELPRIGGFSEKLLKNTKEEIRAAIWMLANLIRDRTRWQHFEQRYPELARVIFTDNYYKSLRIGYVALAQFIPRSEAKISSSLQSLISNEDEFIKKNNKPQITEALDINLKICNEKDRLLEEFVNAFGGDDPLE